MDTLVNFMGTVLVNETMQENQDGGDKTQSISILKLNKLHALLHIST